VPGVATDELLRRAREIDDEVGVDPVEASVDVAGVERVHRVDHECGVGAHERAFFLRDRFLHFTCNVNGTLSVVNTTAM
jgi:hypothetical protein